MLRSLEIHNLLLIDRMSIEFREGLNVLTGETGAGKSILLDALGFSLGWRGRADLVGEGAETAEVTAVFGLGQSHPALDILREAGLPEGEELVLRRTNSKDGRKQSYANDRRCSGETVRSLSDALVELHGQRDQGLLQKKRHRSLLDSFGRLDQLVEETRARWRDRREAERRLREAEGEIEAMARDEGFFRHSVEEIERLSPAPDEEADLDARRKLMQMAGKIREDVEKARQAIGGQGAEASLSGAIRWMEDVSGKTNGAADEVIAALSRSMSELGEAQNRLESFTSALEFNPEELEAVEERLFAMRALARKHGVAVAELPQTLETLREKLGALDGGATSVGDLKKRLAETERAYESAARELSEKRKEKAESLDRAMREELPPLKLERAVFKTAVEPGEPGPDGIDRVSFMASANPGAPAGPLEQIASGGELSRFLLALKVCLASGAQGVTMIFDEIDRGVGGATADAVGRRLAGLAKGSQILAVTHSPQVAARGKHHWRVEKRLEEDTARSTIMELDQSSRTEELARMLSGNVVTDEARAAAAALLQAEG